MSASFLPVTRRGLCAGLIAAPVLLGLAPRPSWSSPAGPAILTVSGAIAAPDGGSVGFDLAALDALPQRQTVTSTPWHEGQPTFSGPTLAGLMEAVGAAGATLRIRALNDYAADMPADDAVSIPVILASRVDGVEIPVRNKGPLFVIYPFDERPDLFNEVYFGRSVWQVGSIEVVA